MKPINVGDDLIDLIDMNFKNIKLILIFALSFCFVLLIIAIKFKIHRRDRFGRNLSHEIECALIYKFRETLLIISGRNVSTTYSICWRARAEAAPATAAAGS